MKLTALELAIIVDTLRGSLSIKEKGMFFTYSEEGRQRVLNHMIEIMQQVTTELDNIGESSKR